VIYLELREKFDESAASTAWAISLAVTVRMLFGKFESLQYTCSACGSCKLYMSYLHTV
jgi:hypothetical protein